MSKSKCLDDQLHSHPDTGYTCISEGCPGHASAMECCNAKDYVLGPPPYEVTVKRYTKAEILAMLDDLPMVWSTFARHYFAERLE